MSELQKIPRSEEIRALQRERKADLETEHKAIEYLLQQIDQYTAEGKCYHCGKPMKQTQVGRCVYADPCGHRLWQGKAKRG
jgi:DNA-directed RNA polymerase subunit RPC12/RpoP